MFGWGYPANFYVIIRMKINQDCQQKALITLFLFLDAYRILIGSFYSLFVPQLCGDHTCTFQENVTDLNLVNKAALGVNAITCLGMIVAFAIEYRREVWIVKHLEVDPKKPDSNLITEIESYPKIKASLQSKNFHYRNAFVAVAVLSVANTLLSGFLVFDYYDGVKTATTYATNTLLILQRVIKSINISRTCQKETKAQSVYLLEPVTFNTIDPDYVKKPEIQMTESPMKTKTEV
jgi:hypothetical protein